MQKYILVLFAPLLLISCFLGHHENTKSSDEAFIKQQDVYVGYLDFKLIGELHRVNKIMEERVERQKFFLECNDWYIEDKDLNQLLKEMEQVDATLAHMLCYYYPCWYTGLISNGEKEYDMTIYAHSAVTISNKDETIFFIKKEKSNLFIVPCDCCE
jgi:hypothetical protein